MPFIADFHIHSSYSRATSKELTFENLFASGVRKGVSLIGTGDCTHPAWLDEMRTKLVADDAGFLRLKGEDEAAQGLPAMPGEHRPVRFIITGEISNIYKRGGKTRKVHNVVILPDLNAAERFAKRLERIGNIRSDGRPILGLDSRDLLETLLEVSDRAMLIPAHIWTPWFSVLGSKSGFDSIEECYADLSSHIYALETGLSSDPPMNWRVSSLDRYTLVSNSDAHSPGKVGREASVFECALGYDAVMNALRQGPAGGYGGTLEFFPEEGKYHVDGHRKCGVCLQPEESRKLGGICPVCGGQLTLGVMYRVVELADRIEGIRPAHAAGYRSVVSLDSILGEIIGTGPSSKKVEAEYQRLIGILGPELPILLDVPLSDISTAGTPELAEAIRRMRDGAIHAQPGYDGEFGVIRVFAPGELGRMRGTGDLLREDPAPTIARTTVRKNSVKATPATADATGAQTLQTPAVTSPTTTSAGLNDAQQRAAELSPGPALVVAGPGTGKTRVLVERVMRLIEDKVAKPQEILAITFSNRAAREMGERVDKTLEGREISGRPQVCTFHRLGLLIVRENAEALGLPPGVTVMSQEEAAVGLAAAAKRVGVDIRELADGYERRLLRTVDSLPDGELTRERLTDDLGPGVREFNETKRAAGAVDFSDLLLLPVMLLNADPALCAVYRARWPHILVDEYQDVNSLQYRLLRHLAPRDADLFAIGDPDQAIYGFRGADVRYFRDFARDYPSARVVTLSRSYRSSDTILGAANAVLGSAALGDKSDLASGIVGPNVMVSTLPTEASEAEHVVKIVEELIGGSSHFAVDTGRAGTGDMTFADIAVLFRTHAVGDAAETALGRSGIPVHRPSRRKAVDELTLDLEIESYDPRAEGVTLMTLHAAKGLEWRVVIIVGCEDGLIPSDRVDADVDEERRLLYVGMTRARERLFLSHARHRIVRGERTERQRTRFLDGVPIRLLEEVRPKLPARKKARADGVQLGLFG